MKITRQRLLEIIKEEVNVILENTVTGDVSHDLMKSGTQIFGVPVKVTSVGVNVDGNRYKIEADGPGRFNPDLTPLKADLVTTADGKHSLDIELDAGRYGRHPGTLSHDTLVSLTDALKGDEPGEWEAEFGDKTILIRAVS